ncbi:MAG: hypothetical protein OJF50_003817 [Nitrospira sp.]|nr:hypothetical protein [Nitrospira sp.]
MWLSPVDEATFIPGWRTNKYASMSLILRSMYGNQLLSVV